MEIKTVSGIEVKGKFIPFTQLGEAGKAAVMTQVNINCFRSDEDERYVEAFRQINSKYLADPDIRADSDIQDFTPAQERAVIIGEAENKFCLAKLLASL